MGDIDDNFALLLGRQPSDKEKQDLYRARDALKLKASDAVWLLLMALQHYVTLYEKIPGLVADAAREATETARISAEAQVKATEAEAKKVLMEAVHKAVVASTNRLAGAQRWKWLSLATTTLCVSFVFLTATAYRRGQQAGFASGMNESRTRYENAATAASWANTPEGHLAYEFAKLGSLAELARCTGRGLTAKEGWCTVQMERGRPGPRWRLPEGTSAQRPAERRGDL